MIQQICIEESTDGSTHTENTDILNPLYGPYPNETGFGCDSGGLPMYCGGSVDAFANSNGSVGVGVVYARCRVESDGRLYCGRY